MPMINREDHYRLEKQFQPLAREVCDTLTKAQSQAFEVGYLAGMDDLVTYLQGKGVALPEEVRGLRASAFVQIMEQREQT